MPSSNAPAGQQAADALPELDLGGGLNLDDDSFSENGIEGARAPSRAKPNPAVAPQKSFRMDDFKLDDDDDFL